MHHPFPLAPLGLAALLLLVATPCPAAGDEHGHAPADAPSAAGAALPRFTAVSEAFELVGVLDGRQLTLYLDRAADNAPVRGARIELAVGGRPLPAEPHDLDSYEATLPAEPAAGALPITATVTVGGAVDRLAGTLDVPASASGDDAAHAHPWRRYAGALLAAAGAVAFAFVIGRRTRRTPPGSPA